MIDPTEVYVAKKPAKLAAVLTYVFLGLAVGYFAAQGLIYLGHSLGF